MCSNILAGICNYTIVKVQLILRAFFEVFNFFKIIQKNVAVPHIPWWRHQMEIFSALLAICAENSPVPCEFPAQRPVTWSFDVYFDLRPNKRLSKQLWGWWFETQSCPLWRHRNALPWHKLTADDILYPGIHSVQLPSLQISQVSSQAAIDEQVSRFKIEAEKNCHQIAEIFSNAFF